jgi:protein required for attachment to host cells
MKLPHGALVVVADGAKMLLLENTGDDVHLDLRVRRHDEADHPATRETGSDRPGRTSAPAARRASLGQTDWHALEKDRFADALAARMNGWANDGTMAHALLIAAPRTLGEIRQHLNDRAQSALLGEIAADLAHQTVEAIETAVEKA